MLLSFTGSLLVSGSIDGICHVWDATSYRIVRTINIHKGAVSSLFLLTRVPDVLRNQTESNRIAEIPIQPLKRHRRNMYAGELRSMPLLQRVSDDGEVAHSESSRKNGDLLNLLNRVESAKGSGDAAPDEIAALKDQLNRLRQREERWRNVNMQLFDAYTELAEKEHE
jgi:hypothetical protein